MADKKYIVDMFEDIVSQVRADYDPTNLLEPYYDYGHLISILNKLNAKDGNRVLKLQKYPLIALIQDIQEDHTNDLNIGYSFSPGIVILATTDKNYTEQQRYQNVLKTILYPIYELLIEKIKYYQFFDFETESNGIPTYKKWDRVNWGTSTFFGNVATFFNDYLDGIEIQFDPINVYRTGSGC